MRSTLFQTLFVGFAPLGARYAKMSEYKVAGEVERREFSMGGRRLGMWNINLISMGIMGRNLVSGREDFNAGCRGLMGILHVDCQTPFRLTITSWKIGGGRSLSMRSHACFSHLAAAVPMTTSTR
jgi:hypothetical protein